MPQRDELRYIVTKGVPMGAQMLVMSAAGIIVVGLVNREGLLMTAAYAAAMQLFTYIQMPAMAIGGAVSAMAAQFIGARKWDRLDQITRAGVLINFAMTGLLTALLLAVRPRRAGAVPRARQRRRCRSPGTSSCSRCGASCCSA